MNKRMITCCLAALLCVGAYADGVTEVEGKTLSSITFEGDNVVLHYADGSTDRTIDMEHVMIVFDIADAIEFLSTEPEDAPVCYFDMQGRKLPAAPQKGMYIMKKGKKVVKLINK